MTTLPNGAILKGSPEEIRRELIELARTQGGLVSDLDIRREFVKACYGDNKRKAWLSNWLQVGLIFQTENNSEEGEDINYTFSEKELKLDD